MSMEKISGRANFKSKMVWFTLDVVSALFWVYVTTQLFIVNIDYKLFEYFAPGYICLLAFKLIAFMLWLSLSLIFLGKWKTIYYTLYVLFFPVIVILVKAPLFAFKQKSWIFAFSFINSIVAIFTSFKRNLILITVYLIGFSVVTFSESKYINIVSAVIAFLCLIYTFIQKFIGVFRTTPVFRFYKKIVEIIRDKVDNHLTLSDELKAPTSALTTENLENGGVIFTIPSCKTEFIFS